ncbi:MAG: anthranilate phosphoribosyltransferase [Campylobacteraceae bacterium]|nr:anthranilate phosphoribosyltransferase [Campylobacteraceae bacterium]
MILMIDNYDSFVYNIIHYIKEMGESSVHVARNDEITLDEIKALNPTHIILSPGPNHPKDSGICLDILNADLDIPILGVCLGHQAIAYNFKAEIKKLETPVHGKSSKIKVARENEIFKSLPEEFSVMRYHSLYADTLPECLEALAISDDDVIMALGHKTKQIYGVQFHPESFFTQYGKKIIENFINLNKKSNEKEQNMENLAPFMKKLQVGFPLDSADYEIICKAINDKNYDIVQLAGLLVLISEKSLYPDSLAAFVKNILKYSLTYTDKGEYFDIVGTGGDGLKTINVSTTTAFIMAALGVKVAKHGNRAVTSKSGSSDALSALGVKFSSSIEENKTRLNDDGLVFFHAPLFHKITAEVKEVRDRLKIGTVFNMLGPLLNPNLGLKYQLAGNYLEEVNELMAETLMRLGRERALVVHGMDGMDEITICDETLIHEVRNGKILEYKITPEQFGFQRAFHKDVEGGTGEENAEILKATLKGELTGPKLDIVVLNAMFGLYCVGKVNSPMEAKELILNAIKDGTVWNYYQNYMSKHSN